MSKLFHTQLVRDLLIEALTETQVRKDFKTQTAATGVTSYKKFKKEWLERKQSSEKKEIQKIAKKKLKKAGERADAAVTEGERIDKEAVLNIDDLDRDTEN
jgi:hypothetical protein